MNAYKQVRGMVLAISFQDIKTEGEKYENPEDFYLGNRTRKHFRILKENDDMYFVIHVESQKYLYLCDTGTLILRHGKMFAMDTVIFNQLFIKSESKRSTKIQKHGL